MRIEILAPGTAAPAIAAATRPWPYVLYKDLGFGLYDSRQEHAPRVRFMGEGGRAVPSRR